MCVCVCVCVCVRVCAGHIGMAHAEIHLHPCHGDAACRGHTDIVHDTGSRR